MAQTPAPSLEPFRPADAATILDWVRSPAEMEAWASLVDAELEPGLFERWHRDPDVHPHVLTPSGRLSAYGEVWEDREEDEAELAGLIVDPSCRGQGVGRTLVTLLAGVARGRGFEDIWVRVVPTNAPALACYRGAGFVRTGPAQAAEFNRGHPRDDIWMRLTAARPPSPGGR